MKPFKPVSKSKYGNRRTNGYASKREAQYAELLATGKRAGVVLEWLEQVPVKLPGGLKYVIDFLVFYQDGSYAYVEVKGAETAVWKAKMRLLQEARPWIYERLEVLR